MAEILIEFDRQEGIIRQVVFDGPDARQKALGERIASEQRNSGRNNYEVVILSAASLDEAKKTHSRYFRTLQQQVFDAVNGTTEIKNAS